MFFCTARVAPEKAVFRPALPPHSSAGHIGNAMAKKATYYEQLRDPRWQKRRLEIMNRDEFKCQLCYDGESTLNVHHKHYHKGHAPWEYTDDELVTLCETCHENIDEIEADRKEILSKLNVDGPYSVSEGLALIAGWGHQYCGHDMSKFTGLSPWSFVVGEIATHFDYGQFQNIGELLRVRDALNSVGAVRRARAFALMVEDMEKPD